MEKINLTIYATSFGQTKDGQITDIHTELLYQGLYTYNVRLINLKVAEIAMESLELITHCYWTLTTETALDAWQLDDLLTFKYSKTIDLETGTKYHKKIYYAVLDGVSDNNIDTSTTKPPKNVMPRTID